MKWEGCTNDTAKSKSRTNWRGVQSTRCYSAPMLELGNWKGLNKLRFQVGGGIRGQIHIENSRTKQSTLENSRVSKNFTHALSVQRVSISLVVVSVKFFVLDLTLKLQLWRLEFWQNLSDLSCIGHTSTRTTTFFSMKRSKIVVLNRYVNWNGCMHTDTGKVADILSNSKSKLTKVSS